MNRNNREIGKKINWKKAKNGHEETEKKNRKTDREWEGESERWIG